VKDNFPEKQQPVAGWIQAVCENLGTKDTRMVISFVESHCRAAPAYRSPLNTINGHPGISYFALLLLATLDRTSAEVIDRCAFQDHALADIAACLPGGARLIRGDAGKRSLNGAGIHDAPL
jgi:hypothetical protein